MSDVFNSITPDDWKRSIKAGRTRENKVAAQIHAATCTPDESFPRTHHCAYSKQWRVELCIHCPHLQPRRS